MLIFFSSLLGFCLFDSLLTRLNLNGVYYFIHSIHNGLIVMSTFGDVVNTFTNFKQLNLYDTNMVSVQLCFALHFYHLLYYWRKFLFEDWLHHGLMIGVALPLGVYLPSSTLLGFSLFFTTGLPGGIDYFLLFLVRNNWLNAIIEKRMNTWLNVWIRSAGCSAHAAFVVAYTFNQSIVNQDDNNLKFYASLVTACLTYWNGQYFMERVVSDYAKRSYVPKQTERPTISV
jgi:hypothetical protein